jgi:subtilisin family serine protease
MPMGRWGGAAALLLMLVLAACGNGGPSGTPTPAPGKPTAAGPAATAPPGGAQSTDKIDNVFLQLVSIFQTQGLDAARIYATDQGLMTKQNEVRVTLVLDSGDTNVVDGTALAVGRLGGWVTQSFEDTIELVMPVQALLDYPKTHNQQSFFKDLADFSHVKSVRRTPVSTPASMLPGTAGDMLPAAGGVSEGVALIGAATWQAAGITGKGVKVGVIDSNFNNYKQFLGNAKVTVKSFRSDGLVEEPGGEIHGTACAEIVHEMAPDAEIVLAPFETTAEFAAALRWLTANGVTVVTASMGFGGTMPADGTSALDQEIDKAKAAGVLFFNSAGNSGSGKIGSDSLSGHIGGTFADGDKDGFADFSGTKNKNGVGISVLRSGSVSIRLAWDDWKQPHVNYDLFLYDSKGQEVARGDNDQSKGTGQPVEIIGGKAPAGQYLLKVKKVKASDPDLPFDIFFDGAQAEITNAEGSLTPPGDAKGAVAVAAISARTGQLEPYSSHGPTRDGRKKPEIGAPDDVTSAAYASTGESSFPGTSAASPHAAGAAALYRQAFPDSTPDAALKYFTDHAKKLQNAGENAAGAGMIFMDAVPQGAKTAPAVTKPMGPTPASGTKVPTGTAKPTPQATGAPNGAAFSDNFSNPSSGLPAAGYQNGEYHFKMDTGGGLVYATYPNKVVRDAAEESYQVDARRVSGAEDIGTGLVFRWLDKNDYLVFVVYNAGGYALYAKLNGSIQAVIAPQANSAVKPNGANRLQVFAQGDTLMLVVNGTMVDKVTLDGVWHEGAFGLAGVGGDNAPSEVAFKDYAVYVR